MGFGNVGLELVPYIAEAGGTNLTVVEHGARPIDEADPAFGDAILEIYREQFDVDILTQTYEQRIEPTVDGGVRLYTEENGSIDAEKLFLFTGRRPNFDKLGLKNTALTPTAGWIDATIQASDDSRSFVVGDANNREPILHVAKEQGNIAADNILRHAAGDDLQPYENVHHHVIFSGLGVYPFARVGHSEQSAAEAGIEYVAVERKASEYDVFTTKTSHTAS